MSGESVIERLNELPAHELRKMVTDDSLYYRAEVLDLARYVLEKRGVKPDANEYRIITPEGEERSSLSASAIEALYKERRINQDTLVFVEEHRLWLKLAHAFDLSEWGHKRQDSCPSAKPPVGQDQDLLKLARQFQADDLSYRREHRWNIFSWASSLLLAVSVGYSRSVGCV